jgi:hypothetical protein
VKALSSGELMQILPQPLVPDLKTLNAIQIKRIDEALAAVGDFGEVRLIKSKGKLRYIQKLDSEKIEEQSETRK